MQNMFWTLVSFFSFFPFFSVASSHKEDLMILMIFHLWKEENQADQRTPCEIVDDSNVNSLD